MKKSIFYSAVILWLLPCFSFAQWVKGAVNIGGDAANYSVIQTIDGGYAVAGFTYSYGQATGEWVDEDSECDPTQEGGKLNLTAEKILQDFVCASKDTSANILRLAGLYGPGRLLSRIDSLKAGTAISGRGDAWLNLIHVDDAVSAVLACTKPLVPGATFNVVDNQPILRSEYFGLLAQLVQAAQPTFNPDDPGRRGSGGLNKRCSNRKLRDKLAWNPVYPTIATGLPASIETSNLERTS